MSIKRFLFVWVIGFAMTLFVGDDGASQAPPKNPIEPSQVSITIDDFTPGNEYFKDINTLYEQIRLLEKLVDRQEKINQMTQSMVDVGRSFDPNPPPADICKKLPDNLLCDPELIPDPMETADNEPTPTPPAVEKPLPILKVGEIIKKDPAKEEKKLYNGLGWTDITCRAGDCRAVIVDTNGDERRQVAIDDTAFGFPVTDISTGRVAIKTQENGTIELNPVPVSAPTDEAANQRRS
jgi:hypothetical protein